ncbi:hypothetical protein [Leptospira adleri]|uniref:Uncharacterized protein n=1 Tax=Leptospira adleri TaxID=2023186 RepID=A0A2M9YSH4_9LEPT|nr:hypothetical protein [Leptospira adleri]PJZ54486.1 hypothetical protein CH380_05320 [Leptospira adleri]PJZ61174.1 hypothetical protein CH376_14635 [Leptospira adleri]
MKIRWKIDTSYFPKTFPDWVLFCFRYPISFLFIAVVVFVSAYVYIDRSFVLSSIPFPWNEPISFLQFISDRLGSLLFSCFLIGAGCGFLWFFWLLALSAPSVVLRSEQEIQSLRPEDSNLIGEEGARLSDEKKCSFRIRWINDTVLPLPGSPRWVVFVSRYPVFYLLPNFFLFPYAYYWHRGITDWESGKTETLYLGPLELLYDAFGIWGVPGFYLLLGVLFLWLFWYYAIRKPK